LRVRVPVRPYEPPARARRGHHVPDDRRGALLRIVLAGQRGGRLRRRRRRVGSGGGAARARAEGRKGNTHSMSIRIASRRRDIKPSITLAVTARAARLRADGIDVIGFGAGEPDFDTPGHIKDAAKKALDAGVTKYTEVAGTLALRRAIVKEIDRAH